MDDEYDLALDEVQKYFDSHPDLAALYANPDAENVQCIACNKSVAKSVFDVYQHAAKATTSHDLLHRGVAAATARMYGNQPPPQRQQHRARESTRHKRRPHSRS
jgi:hypothetical protein